MSCCQDTKVGFIGTQKSLAILLQFLLEKWLCQIKYHKGIYEVGKRLRLGKERKVLSIIANYFKITIKLPLCAAPRPTLYGGIQFCLYEVLSAQFSNFKGQERQRFPALEPFMGKIRTSIFPKKALPTWILIELMRYFMNAMYCINDTALLLQLLIKRANIKFAGGRPMLLRGPWRKR